MSIIFGFPNAQGVTVSEYLTAQGMCEIRKTTPGRAAYRFYDYNLRFIYSGINLLRCHLSAFEAVCTVTINQPAYKNYTNFLPAYMSAYISQAKTSIISPYHPLKYTSSDDIVTTRFPNVSISFNGIPVTETLEAIRAAGGKEMKSKGHQIFLLPSPTSDLLRLVTNGGAIRTTPATTDSVNLACFPTISLVRRIFSNFLKVHQYPAFIDPSHMKYNVEHWIHESGTSKRKADSMTGGGASKRVRLAEGSSTIEDDVTMDDNEASAGDPHVDQIIYAVPPPKIDVAWGTLQQLPGGYGIFIRYVEDTQNGKGEGIVPQVINRYFLGSLGNNAESVRGTFKRVKEDWGIICDTDVGKELAHLAKCIDLGLQCQARVFPIIDTEQYLGCCLLGAGFQIAAYNTVYTPVPNETLQERIGLASSHKAALLHIATIASEGDTELDIYTSVMESCSMMELRNVLLETELTSSQREQIGVAARGLRFKYKPLNISADNLAKILNLIAHPDQKLDNALPIHPLYLLDMNRSHLLWSTFGDLAPSFRFAGGPEVDLTQSRNLPTHVAVRNISLSDALIDLDVTIRDQKYTGSSTNRRSGPFKDRIYTKIEARQILTALCSAVGVTTSTNTKGKERAIENVGADILDDGF